jgi:hypothetical protein
MDMMLTLMSSDFGPHLVVDVSKFRFPRSRGWSGCQRGSFSA